MPDEIPEPEIEMVGPTLPRPVAARLEGGLRTLDLETLDTVAADEARIAKKVLSTVVNEESTDLIVDAVAGMMPWGLGWAARQVLDRLLPDQLLAILFRLVDRVAD
jgi:hypothetical protein